jgi:hypothetical protein
MEKQKKSILTPPKYVCYRTIGKIKVDGHLVEPSWKKAPQTRRFVHITTGEKGRFNTQAMMLWDDEYFYVACLIEETDIFAIEGRRHTPVYHTDPDVELFIDADGDGQNYYEFQINPINIINEVFWDKANGRGGKGIFGWDLIGIKHAVQIQGTLNCPGDKDKGWKVELALPWESMERMCPHSSLPPKPGDTWRINFTRVEKTRQMPKIIKSPQQFSGVDEAKDYTGPRIAGEVVESIDWVWAVAPIYSAHIPESWGYVSFSDRKVGTK